MTTQTIPDEPEAPRLTRAVLWLMALSAAVYFVQVTIVGSENMLAALGSSSNDIVREWWTILTYSFVHPGFWPLALNLVTLYLFGPRLEQAWNAREFTYYYLLCAAGGWLLHFLVASDAAFGGASGAVLGVMLAYALRWPGEEVYVLGVVPMRVPWLVALLAATNLLAGVAGGGPGGGLPYFAHVGGMLAGWVWFWRAPATGGIDRLRQRISPLPDAPEEPPRAVPRSLPRSRERGRDIDEIVAESNAAMSRRAAPATPAPARNADRAIDLDRVLDKISEQGLDSLTTDERHLLEEASRELRRRQ